MSEGGYTNDPHDPGGATNFGITIHDYRAYINHEGTAEDVRNMTVEQAGAIYKAKYWDTVNGDNLPSGVDYCVFDYGVNSGVRRAVHILNMTELKTTDPNKIIDTVCDERLRFLKGLHTWKYFGRGWSTRVAHVRIDSHAMAKGDSSIKPPPVVPVVYSTQVKEPWYTILIRNLRQLLTRS